MRRVIWAILFVLTAFADVQAREEIRSYVVDITVEKDHALSVVETITVNAGFLGG